MTETKLKNTIVILVITILILLTTISVIMTNHRVKSKQPEPKTIIVADTITKVVYDTIYFNHYKTVKLPVTDTLYRDSVKIDSIFVEVPISVYKLDTVFQTDTTQLNLFIQNSGYDVTLDTLYYRLQYTPSPVVPKKNYFREHFRFGLGVSAGYGFFTKKPDIFVGLGFYYVF